MIINLVLKGGRCELEIKNNPECSKHKFKLDLFSDQKGVLIEKRIFTISDQKKIKSVKSYAMGNALSDIRLFLIFSWRNELKN